MDLFLKTPLGEDRHQQIFPVRNALEKGVTVGFGSDFPSSLIPEPNQFWYLQGWVTRRMPGAEDFGAVNVDQAITVEQAIHAFTLGGAKALGGGYAEQFGSIEVGRCADMIVLDRSLVGIPTSEIHETRVQKTIFRGEVVFDRAEAVEGLDVVKIEVTNPVLQNAVDAAELDLLVLDEQWGGACACFALAREAGVAPGSSQAPDQVNSSFAVLADRGHRFARPALTVYWRQTDTTYWTQWTLNDGAAVLWAYDPDLSDVVEILQVRRN